MNSGAQSKIKKIKFHLSEIEALLVELMLEAEFKNMGFSLIRLVGQIRDFVASLELESSEVDDAS